MLVRAAALGQGDRELVESAIAPGLVDVLAVGLFILGFGPGAGVRVRGLGRGHHPGDHLWRDHGIDGTGQDHRGQHHAQAAEPAVGHTRIAAHPRHQFGVELGLQALTQGREIDQGIDLALIPGLGGADQRLRRQHRGSGPCDTEQRDGPGGKADDQ